MGQEPLKVKETPGRYVNNGSRTLFRGRGDQGYWLSIDGHLAAESRYAAIAASAMAHRTRCHHLGCLPIIVSRGIRRINTEGIGT